ncbi:MAG: ABC transporter ATP-binding protein, partial [Phycisphaerae bacterium]|nr:ABC transporter ATP-binding protein [Phycisphaerae bacterium]NIU07707.1 ABC transporter ATP-binding protein [Phycisphaerae bacterium]NIX26670.1 ABC transporter ATP-binding protein [Phycisphaerae bacterium]
RALIGHGAGYGVPDKLYNAFGKDADHIFNVDPVSIWLVKPELLKEGLGDITKMVGEEYKKAEPDTKEFSAHV